MFRTFLSNIGRGLRSLVVEVLDFLIKLILWVIGAVVYLGLGWVIARPYVWLAGGASDSESFWVSALAPLAVVAVLIAAMFARIIDSEGLWFDPSKLKNPYFLAFLTFLCLPIWVNLAALAAAPWMPYTANVLRKLRYVSIPLCLGLAGCVAQAVGFGYAVGESLRERYRNFLERHRRPAGR